MNRYTITIELTESTEEIKRGEYSVLRMEYMSVEDYNKLEHSEKKAWKYVENQNPQHAGQYEQRIYGYLDDVKTPGVKKSKVFEQIVETVDVGKIINAINSKA